MTSVLDKRFDLLPAAAALALAVFAMPANAQMPVAVGDTTEFPAETAALVAATSALFDAIEEAGSTPGNKAPVISGPIVATPASARTLGGDADALTARGPVDHLTGYRITWYPVDRFLGSVDFMGTWDGNRNLVCGYLTWDLSDPDAPVLDDVTATFVDVSSLSRKGEEDIHASLMDANCAYGAIDANYAFFE